MNAELRVAKILAAIDPAQAQGVEIGALDRPLLTRPGVRYVDYATTEELVADHERRQSPVKRDSIVDVDYVWRDKSLAENLGDYAPIDFALASHVIEHVPDLARWFRELGEVIRPGGILSLVVPDHRFIFDRLRHKSGIEDVVAAAVEQRRRPSPRQIFDFYAKHVIVDPEAVWRGEFRDEDAKPLHDPATALAMAEQSVQEYVDCHCWVFSDASFLELLGALNDLDWLGFSVHHFFPTAPGEIDFFVSLGRLDPADPVELRRECAAQSIEVAKALLSEGS